MKYRLKYAIVIVSLFYMNINANAGNFDGDWVNADINTPGITKINIYSNGENVYIRTWGKCHPQDCDWRTVEAYYENGRLIATYQKDFGKTTNIHTLLDSNTMHVNSSTTYKENDIYGRTYRQRDEYFNKNNHPVPNIPTPVPYTPTPGEFRVGPTVKIRPVNDEIKKDQDGIIELYMDNPSLNDVMLTVDARIIVPSGIHITGEGFGQTGSAGILYGVFKVLPGNARTIYITVKGEKTGDFSVQFSGTYYPGGDKDAYQPISLTHSFSVISDNVPIPTEKVIYKCPEGHVLTIDNRCIKESPGFDILAAITIFLIVMVKRMAKD